MGSSGVAPGIGPGNQHITGSLTVDGALGIGTAPLAGTILSIVNAQNGAVPVFIRQSGAQGVPNILVQDSAQNQLAALPQNGGVQPGINAGAAPTIFAGTGAPAVGLGANGDLFCRTDGGALTTIYQKRAGAWVGIV